MTIDYTPSEAIATRDAQRAHAAAKVAARAPRPHSCDAVVAGTYCNEPTFISTRVGFRCSSHRPTY